MRRTSYRPYVILIALLFFIMSFPQRATEKVRSKAIASLSPTWQGIYSVKSSIISLLAIAPYGTKGGGEKLSKELEKLREENLKLQSQIESVREWLLFEDRIEEQVQRLKMITRQTEENSTLKEFYQRRGKELCRVLDLQLHSLPAKVVFREPASWSSSLWLNVGEKNNEALGKIVVSKNSPVIMGTTLIGVVEYVGKKQCRVRLVTDSSLTPAVRVVRGKQQNHHLLEHIEALLFGLELRDEFFLTVEAKNKLFQELLQLKGQLSQNIPDHYLAKGELSGSSYPLWRSRGQLLKGIGFNYDFADEEGPARDLRSGVSLDPSRIVDATAILKVGDLLVTSGLDGVFPAGFRIGTVARVSSLKEGGCAYDIDVLATAGNFDELSNVHVLPPLEFEKP